MVDTGTDLIGRSTVGSEDKRDHHPSVVTAMTMLIVVISVFAGVVLPAV